MATTTVEIQVEEGAQTHRSSDPPSSSSANAQETVIDAVSVVSNTTNGESDIPTGMRFWLIILTLVAVLVLSSVDLNIVATAVPSITDHFHTFADVGWYASAFRLCQCAFQFLFGKAYKLFSIKRVFLFANIMSITGSLICGAATTSTMLVVGRAVAGLGSAGLLSGCFVILVRITPLRRRPMFTGVLGAVEGISTLCAPVIGGVLTQSLGWRWCFYINPPFGVVTLILILCCFPDPLRPGSVVGMPLRQKLHQLDLESNLLLIPALTALFLALSWAGIKYSWDSAAVIGLLIAFAILIIAFSYNQTRRGDSAALPLKILKRRSVIAGFMFIAFGNSTGQVLEYYLPTYFQVVRGYSPAKSGYLMFPIIIGGTVGSLIHGFGTSAIGYYAPFMLISSIILPIAAGLITTLKVDTSFAQLILYTGLAGLATGIGFSGPQNAVQTILPPDDVSLGTSIMLFAQCFGPAVAVVVAQVLFTNQLSTNLKPLVPGMHTANLENMGLLEIMTSVPPAQAAGILMAIDSSISHTWYLIVGLGGATIVGSGLVEWRSVKTRHSD